MSKEDMATAMGLVGLAMIIVSTGLLFGWLWALAVTGALLVFIAVANQ